MEQLRKDRDEFKRQLTSTKEELHKFRVDVCVLTEKNKDCMQKLDGKERDLSSLEKEHQHLRQKLAQDDVKISGLEVDLAAANDLAVSRIADIRRELQESKEREVSSNDKMVEEIRRFHERTEFLQSQLKDAQQREDKLTEEKDK